MTSKNVWWENWGGAEHRRPFHRTEAIFGHFWRWNSCRYFTKNQNLCHCRRVLCPRTNIIREKCFKIRAAKYLTKQTIYVFADGINEVRLPACKNVGLKLHFDVTQWVSQRYNLSKTNLLTQDAENNACLFQRYEASNKLFLVFQISWRSVYVQYRILWYS